MGNRQSTPQDQQNQPGSNQGNNNNNSNNNGGGGAMRPSSRLQTQRDTLRSAFIPVNENQRRDERRLRRERIREQQMNGSNEETTGDSSAALLSSMTEAMFAAAALRNAAASSTTPSTTAEGTAATPTTTTTTESPSMSPFSRMIASVISEAVITSFRNGHIPTPQPPAATTTTTATSQEQQTEQTTSTNNSNVRQQLTMHLSPEVFQQMEPGSTENSFMRFMRLPVIVSSVSTNNESTAVNADGQAPTLTAEESEVTRIIMLPVFLYGIRSTPVTTEGGTDITATEGGSNNTTTEANTTAEVSNAAPTEANNTTPTETTTNDDTTRRRSARIRAANEAAAAATATTPETSNTTTPNHGQWTVYIISGPNVDGIMNDSATYEELLDLASIIGPARLPTVSQESIDSHIPIVKYSLEVKQRMVGNSDGCQICLTNYQSQDNLRILACNHGFHDECICKWLTQGRNQCPLCRDVAVPSNS